MSFLWFLLGRKRSCALGHLFWPTLLLASSPPTVSALREPGWFTLSSLWLKTTERCSQSPFSTKLYRHSPRLSDGERDIENHQLSLRPNAALSPPTQIPFYFILCDESTRC